MYTMYYFAGDRDSNWRIVAALAVLLMIEFNIIHIRVPLLNTLLQIILGRLCSLPERSIHINAIKSNVGSLLANTYCLNVEASLDK